MEKLFRKDRNCRLLSKSLVIIMAFTFLGCISELKNLLESKSEIYHVISIGFIILCVMFFIFILLCLKKMKEQLIINIKNKLFFDIKAKLRKVDPVNYVQIKIENYDESVNYIIDICDLNDEVKKFKNELLGGLREYTYNQWYFGILNVYLKFNDDNIFK